MRNTSKRIGFAVIAAIAIAMTACDQPTDSGNGPSGTSGKLTVSGLPSGTTYAVYVFDSGTDISTFTAITNAYTSQEFQAVSASPSGDVFDLYGWDGTTATTTWTGSGSLPVLLLNTSGSTTGTTNPMYSWTTISFTSGNGTASFSSFTAVEYSGGDIIIPGTGSKLTIDGLPSGGTYTYAVYVFSSGTDISTYQDISTAYSTLSYQAVGATVTSGNAFTLVGWSGISITTAWKGTGNMPVLLLNARGSITETDNPMYSWATVDFNEGTGTANFSDFTAVIMGGGVVNQNPTANDFNIGNLSQAVGNVTAVTIKPKEGKSTGDITIYYNNSATVPTAIGTYSVTFNVAEVEGWNSANGLNAGTLRINNAVINNMSDLAAYLSAQNTNTKTNPYYIALAINNTSDFPALLTTLNGATNKYVYLDLSGSAITTIPNNAFYNFSVYCTTLTRITIPDGVTSIGSNAFSGCSSLTSVTIPDSVISIEDSAFYNCNSLASVTIPASVTSIGSRAFWNCSSLVSVTFQGTIPSSGFSDYDGALIFIGDLRAKFYATDSTNGTPGTYKTTTPVNSSSVWTKQ